ncbi:MULTISPECIES: NUDIX hydrolase [Virgibacillus]|uniref:ADP-ribose pyrophosphatase n=1 Tax=Virgibacillus pantothenticus TaxID=1473 RepID=A0A0L0QP76_VIRPA|nr:MULTISPECIES: NUDIX hydrolase [Virgibacillus]API90469.1 ADP-ribose pyrophosphatase [Virgibacillus sp. 6R]KNE20430.1 ADP-ribose pyrophosphatase [Virgibacillus pantothenticus]MBS7429576.1 NUDIX hydrolase [Virgibacillus sp. 19R1-5]MED3735931.1 NUDIX hydrolase [Virgibacillus pantothenticus]QTY17815.1 NUDIX hydrolase [Virgibacillus pantothenticus]
MKKFEEKTIRSKQIYKGHVVHLQVDDVSLPNGKEAKREIIKHPGAVAVIPITKENKIVLVEQYRKPLEKSILEIPAGKLEPGEEPETTAIRELEEETGYTTDELSFVTSFYSSPGFADELMHIYITNQLQPLEEKVAGDEDEFIEIVELTLEEAKQYVEKERIHDAKTNYAILYLHALGLS